MGQWYEKPLEIKIIWFVLFIYIIIKIKLLYAIMFIGPFEPGSFGAYMGRDRYKEIKRILHFCDNEMVSESSDKFYRLSC